MLNDLIIFNEICDLLAALSETIRLKGHVNLHDEKTASENFFCGLFNIVYNLQLENINLFSSVNYPAIDLADKTTGQCFQITYENTSSKINETKDKYKEHGIASIYPHLTIFIFQHKPKKRASDPQVKYQNDLIIAIQGLPIDKKNEVLEYLKKHLYSFKQAKLSLEVTTIQTVIGFLTEQPFDTTASDPSLDRPFPEEKLKLRFGKYYEIIIEEYKELVAGYYSVLEQAKADCIDDGNSGKIKAYLRQLSRNVLLDNNMDAREALNKVVLDIQQSITKEISITALRFYLLSELIECDIFPLSTAEKSNLGGTNGPT